MSIGIERTGYTQAAMSAVRTAARQPTGQTSAAVQAQTDRVEISAQGRKAVQDAQNSQKTTEEEMETAATAPAPEDAEEKSPEKNVEQAEEEEDSESRREKVAVNEGKRARQIAAARTPSQVQQILALLDTDLQDCKAGLERGACDEAEVQKVEALIRQAQSKMAQVAGNDEEEGPGLSAFDLAGLM